MREVIILAGGRGTRLQHILPGIPKCMAPIRGIPFLAYLMEYLIQQNTTHFIFSLGYLHIGIVHFINTRYPKLKTTIVIEVEALGTGGAIKESMQSVSGQEVFVINGDTFFPVSLEAMEKMYQNNMADLVIASTLIQNPHRYGTLSVDPKNKIHTFHEKKEIESGFINGGTYLLSKKRMLENSSGKCFSFESEILESKVDQWSMYASIQDSNFIDIGIPEDYQKAQIVIPELNSPK